ncbi:MAG TPA: hypothetical protein VFR38_02055, partial [Gaiellaceae bacterium]|nr:hypothetical protein [Gaiellaceae bacterium]
MRRSETLEQAESGTPPQRATADMFRHPAPETLASLRTCLRAPKLQIRKGQRVAVLTNDQLPTVFDAVH